MVGIAGVLPRLRHEEPSVLCLDAGHYHPTETMADKISSVLSFVPEILLHVSRGVRWDSDHVVMLTDDLKAIGEEWCATTTSTGFTRTGLLRCQHQPRGGLGDRRAQSPAGPLFCHARAPRALPGVRTRRGLHLAAGFDGGGQAAPWNAVLDDHCLQEDVPVGEAWLAEVKRYEQEVLSGRQ